MDAEDTSLKSILNNIFKYLRDPVLVLGFFSSLEAVEEYSELNDVVLFWCFFKLFGFFSYKIFLIILVPFALDLYS